MKYIKDIKDYKEAINQVVCGDCMELLKLIPDKSINLVITSPPYFVGKEYEMDCVDFNKYLDNLISIFTESYRVLTEGSYLIVNIDDAHTGAEHPEYNGKSTGNLGTHAHLIVRLSKLFTYKDLIIWHKIRNFSGGLFITHTHYPISAFGEYVLIFKKEGKRDKNDNDRKDSQLNKRELHEYTQGIWQFNGSTQNRFHPAEFPLRLPSRLIKMYSFNNDLIFDPFAGSFTTLMACRDLKRNFIGCDISEKYCKIGEQRLAQEVLF